MPRRPPKSTTRRRPRRRSPALRDAGAQPTRIVPIRSFDDRIALIQRQVWKTMTDRGIRQLAIEIVTKRCGRPDTTSGDGRWCYSERDRWAEVVAIFQFIRASVRYTSDTYGLDTYQTGRRTLELRAGDCDDFTILLCGMLLSIGHNTRLKSVELRDEPGGFSHIYAEVLLDSHWRPLDASSNRVPGWEVPRSRVLSHRIDRAIPLVLQ